MDYQPRRKGFGFLLVVPEMHSASASECRADLGMDTQNVSG